MPPVDVEALVPLLRAAVGDAAVSDDAADLAAVTHDLWPVALIRDRRRDPLPPPAAVVWPADAGQVSAVLRLCHDRGVAVVPFGAGTGVCGAALGTPGAVVLDLKRMARIVSWDLESGHVTAQPGILGIHLEAACLERGWTTGHYPSSLPVSTLGGFVATRSVGQLSTRYGRIDDMVVGLTLILPDGTPVRLSAQPSSGAGPDLRRLLLGSEGAFGVFVEVTLRLHRVPEHRVHAAHRLPDFATGVALARDLLQAGLRPALLRLYDPDDTALQADHLGVGEGGGCLLLTTCEGRRRVAAVEADELDAMARDRGGEPLGPGPVEAWYHRRYDIGFAQARYLPVAGTVIDTIEVAAPWSRLPSVYTAVKERMRTRMVTLCHLSHGYPDGACLYFTFAGGSGDEAGALDLHRELWDTVTGAVLQAGGTIAHHHGAGRARAPYLEAELGPGGVELLRRLRRGVDPAGIANPGTWGAPV